MWAGCGEAVRIAYHDIIAVGACDDNGGGAVTVRRVAFLKVNRTVPLTRFLSQHLDLHLNTIEGAGSWE